MSLVVEELQTDLSDGVRPGKNNIVCYTCVTYNGVQNDQKITYKSYMQHKCYTYNIYVHSFDIEYKMYNCKPYLISKIQMAVVGNIQLAFIFRP